MVAAIILLLAILFVRRPWAARLVQMALLLGTLEWVRTLIGLPRNRLQAGAPLLRLVVILGAVALLTACSILAFETRRLRRRYRVHPPVA